MGVKRDKIILKNMQFYGYHGVFSAEREMGERFEVDLELEMDLTRASKEDDLDLTVNYIEVYELVREMIDTCVFKLLEAMTLSIVESVLEEFPMVSAVTARVRKPSVPIGGIIDYAAVEIKRER